MVPSTGRCTTKEAAAWLTLDELRREKKVLRKILLLRSCAVQWRVVSFTKMETMGEFEG